MTPGLRDRTRLREPLPDRVIYLYASDGTELRRIDAGDATPDNTIEFTRPLKVAAIQILAAGEVYA